MTSYERVLAAIEHREADRVPYDLGASVLTGINKKTYIELRKYLGLPEKEVQIVDMIQQLARPDKDLLDRLQVDVACVDPDPASIRGLEKDPEKKGSYWHMTDEWGIEWRMPVDGGLYYDMIGHPLEQATLLEEIEKYQWPDPINEGRFKTLKSRADSAVFTEKKAYILGRQYAGIWETALWISGFEKYLTDMMVEKEYAHALMNKITELKMAYWNKALDSVGENVLIVSEADDLATQSSLLCSPGLYEELVHPYHKKLFTYIKEKAKSKVYIFYHSCGAVRPLIPYLIDEGVDILNPVQVNADGMDSGELKALYGDKITFWGGGVDTQRVLPFGSPSEVRTEVKRRIQDFAPGGGFVFAAVHNVQGDVSPENFMAMWDAMREFGVY